MEKFAQILYSKNGFPEKASNQKKKIFENYYDDTFKSDKFKIEGSEDIVKNYYLIKEIYENKNSLIVTDQKIFYIIYLQEQLKNNSIEENIELLENALLKYKENQDLAFSRKLIQMEFKTYIDEKIREKRLEKKEL